MHVIGKIREFRTAQFTVIVDAIEETDVDLSWDEDGSIARDIDRGKLTLFCARARVIHDTLGELASDYLGGCVYESLEQFGYFNDMIYNVCADARRKILEMRQACLFIRVRRVAA